MTMLPSLIRVKNSIPAMDFSGTIIAKGPTALPNLEIGMRVFGVLETAAMLKGNGTLCEYINVSASSSMIMPVPENCSLEQAGCMAIGGMMSYLICKNGGIKEDCGLRILVNGASGGCGTIFVQVAKAMGAEEIAATCSSPNFGLMRELGADKLIDYRGQPSLQDRLAKDYADRPFDVIVDMVGNQDLYVNSPHYLKEDGVFVNIGDYTKGTFATALHWFLNTWWPRWLGGTPRNYKMFPPSFEPDVSVWFPSLIAKGQVRAVIERTMGFEEVLEVRDYFKYKRLNSPSHRLMTSSRRNGQEVGL